MNQCLSSFYHQIKKKNLINFSFSLYYVLFSLSRILGTVYTEMFLLMAKMFSEDTRKKLYMKLNEKMWLNNILLSLCLSWTFLSPHYPKVDHSHKSFLSDWCKSSLIYIEQIFECSQS